MEYRTGSVGRTILARFDHGEEIVPALASLCETEKVCSGWFFLFGALAEGSLVCGPKDASLPPDPQWRSFPMPHEILGTGSIADAGGKPALHLHAALGRGDGTLTGCIRKDGKAFIVVEALILELVGIAVSRRPDPKTGFDLLAF